MLNHGVGIFILLFRFEGLLDRVCHRLRENKSARSESTELGQIKVKRATALLRGELLCGGLTLGFFGRMVLVPTPITSLLTVLSGAGLLYLGDKRRKLEETLVEIDRLDDMCERLKELGGAVMGKAEELRQVANWGYQVDEEDADDFVQGWEEETKQWTDERAMLLHWARNLVRGLNRVCDS